MDWQIHLAGTAEDVERKLLIIAASIQSALPTVRRHIGKINVTISPDGIGVADQPDYRTLPVSVGF